MTAPGVTLRGVNGERPMVYVGERYGVVLDGVTKGSVSLSGTAGDAFVLRSTREEGGEYMATVGISPADPLNTACRLIWRAAASGDADGVIAGFRKLADDQAQAA